MSQEPNSPFALPGMSAAFLSPSANPLLTSMDMMRQAMGNLGYGSGASPQSTGYSMSPQDLEKRIADLRVVENWLKLNLSMLSSTIQGLEVQAATVKTLQSFVAMGQTHSAAAPNGPSPLEVVLGLKPSPNGQPEPVSEAAKSSEPVSDTRQSEQQAAAQGWWQMLENQFAQIAAATANAAKLGEQAVAASTSVNKPAVAKKAPAKTPRRATKSSNKPATRTKKTD